MRRIPPRLTASLVIVTINRADSLRRTLESLRQLRYSAFEVIVVNGPSRDHTAEALAAQGDAIRIYPTDTANISMARNIGLAHARGDIVAFIDDDAVPEPDWLDNLMRVYADPEVMTAGGFIRDADGFGFQARYTICNRFGEARQIAEQEEIELGHDEFLGFTGTNFSARRDALIAIGGFDEAFVWFLDETDVNLRMHDRGWRFATATDAEIHHKYEAGVTRDGSRVPRTMYPQLRSKAYFCLRHNLGRKPLADILEYVAGYVDRERAWKRDLLRDGRADQTTVDRLIADVERGAADGVRDALRLAKPALLSDRQLADADGDAFRTFPLPLASERRLRLCICSREYPPSGNGGVGQWTRELAVGLARRGHEITVIARALDGRPAIDFVDGVWVHRISPVGISEVEAGAFAPAPASLTSYSLALFREIERVSARRRFDLISAPIVDLEAMAALKLARVPVVVSLHTTYRLSLPYKPDWLSRPDYLANHVEPAIAYEKLILERAPRLLANSAAIIADIEAAHGLTLDQARMDIVPHGISDLALEAPPMERDGKVHLLFVGRLEERKGADVLLAVLPQLLRARADLVADIVGDDGISMGVATLRAKYEADNAEAPDTLARTRFHGAETRAEVLKRYAACDIFVAPSKYESFGLVFIEAMCFGKPVVAFRVGGAAEIVTDSHDGLLAPVGDAEALADCIGRLAADRNLREALGRNARATYEARFTAETMVDTLESCYRGVVEPRNEAANLAVPVRLRA